MRLVAALAVLASVACVQPAGFPCASDAVCVREGTQGTCEDVGACSFPDSACPSGRRFGAQEMEGLAGRCVVEEVEVDAGPLPANLVTNPSFETDLSGWDTYNSTLTRIPDGHSGGFACQVCSMGAVDYTIDDNPATVPGAPTGVTYVAAAWVRIPAGQPTQMITLTIRERDGDLLISEQTVAADSTWREIRVMHTTSLAGADVDVHIGNLDFVGGCFDVDDVTLGQL